MTKATTVEEAVTIRQLSPAMCAEVIGIDLSRSMDEPNKLPLLKQSFRLMLGELRPEDQVAIVEYAGSAGVALEPTQASDRQAIEKALANLGAGGSTSWMIRWISPSAADRRCLASHGVTPASSS